MTSNVAGAHGEQAPVPGPVPVPEEILAVARAARRVVVLSGAGMSDESGVPTFRDAHTGLWERFDADALVTRDAWEEDPELVWGWHWWLARLVRRTGPHPGHLALADWGRRVSLDVVTQNVDDLHERAGSEVLAHLHGNLFGFSCHDCGAPHELTVEPLGEDEQVPARIAPPECPQCGGSIRHDIVLFGEHLPAGAFDAAVDAMLAADLCLVVGTSGIVQPAGSLPDIARGHGVTVVEINPNDTVLSWGVDHIWRETAGRALPALVAAL
ncbi:MAG: NAD-dependent protein deacylase [Austwickia sp.]|nr:NAD-dependent protein deacylase [Actinomycetota bacterium]MCB1255184.1 NAD-dependent protein deacylase [Austwickia sp.]